MCAKLFMKEPIKKAEYAPRRFRAFLDLIRPFTLLAPAIGGLMGAFLGLVANDGLGALDLSFSSPFITWEGFPFFRVLSGMVSLVFANAASNTLNQVYDRHIDQINKPYRPIPSGIITAREGVWISVLLYAIALWRAALVNRTFAILVCIIILITIAYSIPPLRFKKRLWVSNISIAVPRGMLGIVAAWSMTSDINDPTPWVIGSVLALFLVGSMTTKDFTDIKGDGKYGIRTLPVVYGKKKAIAFSAPFFVLPFLLMGAYWYLELLPYASIYMAAIFLIWSIIVVFLLFKESDREDARFENSPVWKQMYLLLMGMQIGFLTIFIV